MRKLLPILMALIGLAGGAGAGFMLRPPADAHGPATADGGEVAATDEQGAKPDTGSHEAPPAEGSGSGEGGHGAPLGHEFVKLNNQFVVPVMEGGDIAALVILSISLEVTPGSTESVYAMEPKLRDIFLRVLFDHANAGGFRGAFTQSNTMDVLRSALREAAAATLGKALSDVLIIDIVRQDT